MYTGQPVPSTTYQQARAKVSDGKSVRVSAPANSGEIKAGTLCYCDGFLGVAMANLANDAEKAQDLILQIELAEYETDQIDETQDFARGTKIYWDDSAKKLTETPTPVLAGVVTEAKDANNVIWFRLVPGIINDEAAEVIGDLTTLTTTEKGTVVGAINAVDASATAAQSDATAALARVAANVVCAETADADAVRAALRDLLAALETAGLMAAADGGE